MPPAVAPRSDSPTVQIGRDLAQCHVAVRLQDRQHRSQRLGEGIGICADSLPERVTSRARPPEQRRTVRIAELHASRLGDRSASFVRQAIASRTCRATANYRDLIVTSVSLFDRRSAGRVQPFGRLHP